MTATTRTTQGTTKTAGSKGAESTGIDQPCVVCRTKLGRVHRVAVEDRAGRLDPSDLIFPICRRCGGTPDRLRGVVFALLRRAEQEGLLHLPTHGTLAVYEATGVAPAVAEVC